MHWDAGSPSAARFALAALAPNLRGPFLGAVTTLFPNTELMFIFFPVPIKAKYLAIGYAVIELYQGIGNQINDHVSHMGHIGGLISGFLLDWYWNKTNRKTFY